MSKDRAKNNFDLIVLTGLPYRATQPLAGETYLREFKDGRPPSEWQDKRSELVQRLSHEAILSCWWRSRGYRVRVHQFGWFRQPSFDEGMAALDTVVRSSRRPVRLLAESAGTLAGAVCLEHNPGTVERLVAIAGPLNIPPAQDAAYWKQPRIPATMHEAYRQAKRFFTTAPAEQLAKITTAYGPGDDHVPHAWSQRPELQSYELPPGSHSAILLGALSTHSAAVKALLHA